MIKSQELLNAVINVPMNRVSNYFHSVIVISLSLSQSNHIKWLILLKNHLLNLTLL
jgi:hypothetical protein